MTERIHADNRGSRIVYRVTPWDERALEVATREIIRVECAEGNSVVVLLESFDRLLASEGVGFCSCRIDAHNRGLIRALQRSGFRYIETSLVVVHSQIQTYAAEGPFAREVPIRGATIADRDAIREIAASSFDYGRMQEDPDVPKVAAERRQRNWVDDLFEQNKLILVYENSQQIMSFMACEETGEGEISLILGGSRRGCGLASVWFWNSLLARFREQGKTRVRTVVSGANYGVLNLYMRCGFKVEQMLVGLHKHYNRPNPKED